ncbi:MAG: flagellar hook protein FlgE [Deltaproteobacteria bacterium]
MNCPAALAALLAQSLLLFEAHDNMTVRNLQTGVSGLRTEREAMDVVADNLANVNTTGFKRQRSGFEDVFLGDGGTGAGAGSRLGSVDQVFTQGALRQTGNATDVALTGEGFFAVAGSVNGMTGTFYSRAGTFHFDPAGTLVDSSGLAVLGRPALPDGTISTGIQPIYVSSAAVPASASSALELALNLNAAQLVPAQPFDVQSPETTASFGTSIEIFDSLGAPHALDVYFNKLGDNQWEYRVLASGDELNPNQPGLAVEVGSGQVAFTTDGAMQTFSPGQAVDVSFAGATPNQSITVSLGPSIDDGGTGLEGATQFAMDSGVSAQSQNGFSSGALSGVRINADGTVEALSSNGRARTVGQLQVAAFRSPDGLARAGSNLWAATTASGGAVLGDPGTGGRGTLSSGALETANVDVGEEMVSMIQHQRAFSANSKVIAAADDMLSELMQLKR